VQMTMRCVHLTVQHKREAAEKLESYNRENILNWRILRTQGTYKIHYSDQEDTVVHPAKTGHLD